MYRSQATKKGLAATYLIIYVSTVLWAIGTSGGASGGMAFVFPVILGFPWSLLLGLLLLVVSIPRIMMLVLLLLVPPAMNLYLILRANGFFRAQRDFRRSVFAKDSEPHNHDVR